MYLFVFDKYLILAFKVEHFPAGSRSSVSRDVIGGVNNSGMPLALTGPTAYGVLARRHS